jgi:hypothetical protein
MGRIGTGTSRGRLESAPKRLTRDRLSFVIAVAILCGRRTFRPPHASPARPHGAFPNLANYRIEVGRPRVLRKGSPMMSWMQLRLRCLGFFAHSRSLPIYWSIKVRVSSSAISSSPDQLEPISRKSARPSGTFSGVPSAVNNSPLSTASASDASSFRTIALDHGEDFQISPFAKVGQCEGETMGQFDLQTEPGALVRHEADPQPRVPPDMLRIEPYCRHANPSPEPHRVAHESPAESLAPSSLRNEHPIGVDDCSVKIEGPGMKPKISDAECALHPD